MTVPFRVYLDSNVLVSAILESDPNWQQTHREEAQSKAQQIQASRKIFLTSVRELKTSVYAVSEFISKGRTERFGHRTLEEMLNLASDEILSRCEILYFDMRHGRLPRIDSRWDRNWMLAQIRCNAETVDRRNNRPLGFKNIHLSLGTDLSQSKNTIGTGDLRDFEHAKIVRFNSIEYRAPAFEILLFTKASEIANECDVHLGHALHVLCAQGRADFILTNDQKFHGSWETNPGLVGRTRVRVESAVRFVQTCQDDGWL